MLYTGNQAVDLLLSIIDRYPLVIAAPYMSTVALNVFKTGILPTSNANNYNKTRAKKWNHPPMIPSNTEIITTFAEQFEKKISGKFTTDKKYGMFDYQLNKSAIYFDHKLADMMSVYQNIIALGVYYDETQTWKEDKSGKLIPINPISLIKGCDYTEYVNTYHELAARDIQYHLKDQMCPPAFYKYLNYTLNGNPITKLVDLKL